MNKGGYWNNVLTVVDSFAFTEINFLTVPRLNMDICIGGRPTR